MLQSMEQYASRRAWGRVLQTEMPAATCFSGKEAEPYVWGMPQLDTRQAGREAREVKPTLVARGQILGRLGTDYNLGVGSVARRRSMPHLG